MRMEKCFVDLGLMRDSNTRGSSYAQITTMCAISLDQLRTKGLERDRTKGIKKRDKKHKVK